LQEFSKTVSEYSSSEQSKKDEIETKVNFFMSKWTELKMEMAGQITPQALDKLDQEYQKIAKEYKNLAGKS
jgi:hypothetical protein